MLLCCATPTKYICFQWLHFRKIMECIFCYSCQIGVCVDTRRRVGNWILWLLRLESRVKISMAIVPIFDVLR